MLHDAASDSSVRRNRYGAGRIHSAAVAVWIRSLLVRVNLLSMMRVIDRAGGASLKSFGKLNTICCEYFEGALRNDADKMSTHEECVPL